MTEKETEENMFMEFIADNCKIDINEKIEYPPVCLSYGEKVLQSNKGDTIVPIALGTYGNLSVVTAPPKTKKTFFVSLLASAFLSGTNIYGGKIKGHRGDGDLIHFDTEQGNWHAAKVFRRPLDMDNNIPGDKYHTFALRTIGFKERLQFIEYYLRDRIDKPSLVIVDGVADLLADVNNIEQTNQLVSALMRISTQYNCHIINVIHQNYGSQKLGTGHLGSALEKKAEVVISLEANTVNKDWVTVKCGRSRGYAFDTFSFQVNEKGLPIIVNNLYDPLK
ncbi:AAA family ATPase [uncultured Wocania sp.]|uniref:AAA family ATPase n=1 Tax=uncultured Wocania sp. TaxID=2834404 RepID=UPI0030FA7F7C